MGIYATKQTIGVEMTLAQEIIRVLIVDDVPQVRQELATMLRLATRNTRPKIEVIGEAQDGNEAIALSERLCPDVVLMDLEMPVLDGYSATRFIKSMNPSILVIILTIHNEPMARQDAALARADAFFEKGAPISELLQAIQSFRRES
jgi:DNA-binding NarL/FixJ family response regulator